MRYSRAMADNRKRFYVTTAIAYANNQPGLHTLYEVIGADVIARWHRMLGDETRFLTGTDEHSVNIVQRAAEEGISPRAFVDQKVELFHASEGLLGISPDRFIRTSDPDHHRSAQEMVRRAYAHGDIYLGTYEGWYCPNEGFRTASEVVETAAGTICPNHPGVPLEWLSERNWFFRLSAYQERLERHFAEHPDFVQPDYRRNEMLGFIRGGLEDFSISRAGSGWGIPFPIAEDGSTSLLEDGTWDPSRGHDLRLVRRPDQLHHWGRLPRRPGRLRAVVAGRPPRDRQGHCPVPHDLLAGDALERRPRRAEPCLGPRLAAAQGRRADEQEPGQLLRPERRRGGARLGWGTLRHDGRGRLRPGYRGQLGLVHPALQRRSRKRFRESRQPDGVDGPALPRRRPPGGLRRGRPAGRLGGNPAGLPGRARGLPSPCRPGHPVGVRQRGQPAGRRREALGAGQGGQGRGPGWPECRPPPAGRPGRSRRGLPARHPGRRAVPAGYRSARLRPARVCLAVCGRRQRRAAGPR